MSKTIYFTDDEDVLVEFGLSMPLSPREGAEVLWLHAGGQIRRTTVVPGRAGYNPPPDNVKRPEKPPPAPPAKTAQKPPTRNVVQNPFAGHIPGLRAQPGQAGASSIELNCHKCGAIAEASFYIAAKLPRPALEAWLESLSDEDLRRLSAWTNRFSLAFESIFGPISEAFEEIGQALTDGIGNGATNA